MKLLPVLSKSDLIVEANLPFAPPHSHVTGTPTAPPPVMGLPAPKAPSPSSSSKLLGPHPKTPPSSARQDDAQFFLSD